MKSVFQRMNETLKHLKVLHEIFIDENNFNLEEELDHKIYIENENLLKNTLIELNFYDQLYAEKSRQMILADFCEYIFLGRGYYSIKDTSGQENFVRAILHFINLLMCYEVMTVSKNRDGVNIAIANRG